MKILMISPQLPFPPTTGGRRGIYLPMCALRERGHQIHLACLMGEGEEEASRALAAMVPLDAVAIKRRPTVHGAFASLLDRTPYQLSRFHHREFLQRCRSIAREGGFDLIQVEGIHAAWYGLRLASEFKIPIVLRVHDVLSSLMAKSVAYHRDPMMKLWLLYDAWRVRAYEKKVYGLVDMNMAVSDEERRRILGIAPGARCAVVPCGTELDECVPTDIQEEPDTVLWIGAFNHAPNVDSFWWFYREIVPLIVNAHPGVHIRVVGNDAPAEIMRLRHPHVEILGFVPDFRPVMARSSVCVVPLRIGSGVRVRLLEMFAMQKAVVATRVGAEGLGVEDGEHVLIADTARDFAESVGALLDDRGRREELGKKARGHVARNFSLGASAAGYEAAYGAVVKK